ncbi:MAG TPA: potassium channel protein [Holophagaceae bacterium]|nr:potassium channel protein [Holophagaceae bacterium]
MRDLPPLHRFRFTVLLLAVVVCVGAAGYHTLSKTSPVDSFYMAVTTLFTVGFREMGEVSAGSKLFTIGYLIAGLGVATYALSNLTALIVEGDLQGYIRERRMDKRLDALQDHIIVCGLGKMGFQAVLELKAAGVPFVVIEQDGSKGNNPKIAGEIILHGNAMHEHILERAGIRRARGLMAALTSDADNVLVTLMAKELKPDLLVVARNAKLGTERQLKAAGATHIVSPYEIGGRRMAALLMNPNLMDMFDVVLNQDQIELGLERIQIHPSSWMAGKVLREARMRDTTGCLIVGIRREGQGLHFNPQGSDTFEAGDEVLVMGPTAALKSFESQARGDSRPGD